MRYSVIDLLIVLQSSLFQNAVYHARSQIITGFSWNGYDARQLRMAKLPVAASYSVYVPAMLFEQT